MKVHNHLGFLHSIRQLRGNVLIPKYYNPEIQDRLRRLKSTHDLVVFADLLNRKEIEASTGDEIGKMAYGTGSIPFVRTSDISNWEIKTDPKQGVNEEVYASYAKGQDVKPGDLLFVRDGTYLIGEACIVTEADAKILYQSHLIKFRVRAESNVSAPLLLALLSSPIVRKQIRAKQFTADIIDTLGNRFVELVLPVPRSVQLKSKIEAEVKDSIASRVRLRERLRRIPLWAEGILSDPGEGIPPEDIEFEPSGNVGFLMSAKQIQSGIFVPRYYDPHVNQRLNQLSSSHEMITLGELVKEKIVRLDTGIEVGKMAYGTGSVPFVRTSDISNWELKTDPKQSVSEELYEQYQNAQDVREEDIFVVRDGTYLVGTSCILTEHDTRILYCGGMYKIRISQKTKMDPFLLLALLNSPIVRRQMRSKQFTRDVIDTLGKRIYEVVLPIPKNKNLCKKIADVTRTTVLERVELRNRAKQIATEIEGGATEELENETTSVTLADA